MLTSAEEVLKIYRAICPQCLVQPKSHSDNSLDLTYVRAFTESLRDRVNLADFANGTEYAVTDACRRLANLATQQRRAAFQRLAADPHLASIGRETLERYHIDSMISTIKELLRNPGFHLDRPADHERIVTIATWAAGATIIGQPGY
jgi:hypothetical protein